MLTRIPLRFWAAIKPTFNYTRHIVNKLIRYQCNQRFIQHCLIHREIPKGLSNHNSPPPPTIFDHTFQHEWNKHNYICDRIQSTLLMKYYRKTSTELHKVVNKQLNIISTKLPECHYNTLQNNLMHEAQYTFNTSTRVKLQKLHKLTGCNGYNFQLDNLRVYSNHQCNKKPPHNRHFRKTFTTPQHRQYAELYKSQNTTDDLNLVVNLSDHQLSETEESLLKKGLSFCPTPKPPDTGLVAVDLKRFDRRCRLREFFSRKPSKEYVGLDSIFGPASTFTPKEGEDVHLDAYLKLVETDIISNITHNFKDNLSLGEREALTKLKNNKHITIKPADKGGAVVVMNTSEYIEKGKTQLSDTTYYTELNEDRTKVHINKIDLVLIEGRENNYISKRVKTALSPSCGNAPTAGRFYMLPKIHKQGNPGRPIISGCGTPTEKISQFVDFFLQPLVITLNSHIKDTNDFLAKIGDLNNRKVITPNTILATADVRSLYTNIPRTEGIAACEYYLNKRTEQVIPTEWISKLINLVLTLNHFTFEKNKFYLQIFGTAMGTKMAPSYANLFMGNLERTLLQGATLKPSCWYRYIDDIFIVWNHGQDTWNEFANYLNSFHPTIKFTSEISKTSVSYLDTTVSVINGKLETDLYTKPTDTFNYLLWSSCHPHKTKSSIPYGLAHRLVRICSRTQDLHKRLQELYCHLRKRNFPHKEIVDSFDRALLHQRTDLLKPKQKKPKQNPERVPLILTYNPNLNAAFKIPSEKLPILHLSSNCKNIFPQAPMTTWRRAPNLRDLLVSSTIPSHTPEPQGFQMCDKNTTMQPDICNFSHQYTHNTNTFKSSINHATYTIKQKINCMTPNVIYLITCKLCTCQYIGESRRRFFIRAREHDDNIRLHRDTPVSLHFQEPGHDRSHLLIHPIEHCRYYTDTHRKHREDYWISVIEPSINIKRSLDLNTITLPNASDTSHPTSDITPDESANTSFNST